MIDITGMTILIIDDNQYIRDLVKSVLRGFGIKAIYEAANGLEGYKTCCEFRSIDMILCDIEMAPIHGIEFVRLIRSGTPPKGLHPPRAPSRRIPIIMLTAHAKRALVDKCREAGVNGFLVKPINPQLLRDRIEKVATYLQTQAAAGTAKKAKAEQPA